MERSPTFLEKIGSLIPGYAGYADREGRRQCDKILRSQISSELRRCEIILQERLSVLVNEKKYAMINEIEACRKQINTLSSKVLYAPYGASAFFSDAQIKEPELKTIYEKDVVIMEQVSAFKASLNEKSISEISTAVRNIDELLDSRNQYIKEFK